MKGGNYSKCSERGRVASVKLPNRKLYVSLEQRTFTLRLTVSKTDVAKEEERVILLCGITESDIPNIIAEFAITFEPRNK